jgi:hypothetical protein
MEWTHPALRDCYAGDFRLSRWDERRAKIILRWTFVVKSAQDAAVLVLVY